MDSKDISRRRFIQNTIGAAALVTLSTGCSGSKTPMHDSKGLPTAVLGKTGLEIPRLVFGTGSRYMSMQDEEEAQKLLTYAVDHGLYYWDSASTYERDDIKSEIRLGRVVKDRRKELVLSTKVIERDPEKAKMVIDRSFERLQTDYIDIYNVHRIETVEDIQDVCKKGGVFDILRKYKDQGAIGNIGFTGHSQAAALKYAAENYGFDSMLMALNHYTQGKEKREEQAVPAASGNGLGVLVMKVIRPRETVKTIKPEALIRYALTLDKVNAAVIGMESIDVMKANITILKSFKPMAPTEMKKMQLALAPFYNSPDLPWMQSGYEDGCLT